MDETHFLDKFLKTYRKGEIIFEEGSPGQHMCVINSGSVDIRKGSNGGQVHLSTLGQGDVFGEMALVDNLPRSASAVAAEDNTAIVEIGHSHFVYLVGQQPAFALVVLKALSMKLRNQMVAGGAPAGAGGRS